MTAQRRAPLGRQKGLATRAHHRRDDRALGAVRTPERQRRAGHLARRSFERNLLRAVRRQGSVRCGGVGERSSARARRGPRARWRGRRLAPAGAENRSPSAQRAARKSERRTNAVRRDAFRRASCERDAHTRSRGLRAPRPGHVGQHARGRRLARRTGNCDRRRRAQHRRAQPAHSRRERAAGDWPTIALGMGALLRAPRRSTRTRGAPGPALAAARPLRARRPTPARRALGGRACGGLPRRAARAPARGWSHAATARASSTATAEATTGEGLSRRRRRPTSSSAAGVSRDVFYEHFSDKQHAFLEAQQPPDPAHPGAAAAAAYFGERRLARSALWSVSGGCWSG